MCASRLAFKLLQRNELLIVLLSVLLVMGDVSDAFTKPWKPDTSDHFQASSSSTFQAYPEKHFALHYADGTELRSFDCNDQVTIGRLTGKAPFACIYHCNSPDFNGVDGILGFGRPHPGSNYPTPLFWALSGDSNGGMPRKYSFLSTPHEAELQLGGYNPDSVQGPMTFVDTLNPNDFTVRVQSLRLGHSKDAAVELLQFAHPAPKALPAIMDSGTSCLVMPSSNLGGILADSPYSLFKTHAGKGKSFYLTIEGHEFEIPFEDWYLEATKEACVEPSPGGVSGLLIGDVFFRKYLVQFDMTRSDKSVLGIAEQRPGYTPAKTIQSVPGGSQLQHLPVLGRRSLLRSTQVDDLPVFNRHGTQYFVNVSVGTPGQHFTVIFDTGSSVFGLFVRNSDLPVDIRKRLPMDLLQIKSTGDFMHWGWQAMGEMAWKHVLAVLLVVNASALFVAYTLYYRKPKSPLSSRITDSKNRGAEPNSSSRIPQDVV